MNTKTYWKDTKEENNWLVAGLLYLVLTFGCLELTAYGLHRFVWWSIPLYVFGFALTIFFIICFCYCISRMKILMDKRHIADEYRTKQIEYDKQKSGSVL